MHRFALSLLVFVPALAQDAAKTHLDFRAEATAAYQRKNYTAAKEATQAALGLRPDSPRYLHNLAALSALTNEPAAAIDYLRRIAALGVAANVERDPDLAILQGTPQFARVLHDFATNRGERGEAELIAELHGRNGVLEGIAFREKTGDLFLGDAHLRCIWRRDRDGRIARFSAEDEDIYGIFGLAIDEPRNALWATMTALPEMADYTTEFKGRSGVAEFNLGTGELRRVIPVPDDGREHGLGDLTLAPDGTLYLTDSKAPVIWQLAFGAEELQKVVDSPVFGSLQGIVVENRTLLVADFVNGFFTVDLATGNVTALVPPKAATLVGIDGIVTVPGGVVAIQNGTDPQRVIRVAFTPTLDAVTGVTVLAAGLANLTDLGLITLANGRPTFIAGAGWDGFDVAKIRQPPTHTVRIFQVSLPP
jgi:hypothetical protein